MPPVGMNLYVIKRIAPDSFMLDIYKGVLVFAVAHICTLIILTYSPELRCFFSI